MAENLPTAANEVRNIERPSDPVHENGKTIIQQEMFGETMFCGKRSRSVTGISDGNSSKTS